MKVHKPDEISELTIGVLQEAWEDLQKFITTVVEQKNNADTLGIRQFPEPISTSPIDDTRILNLSITEWSGDITVRHGLYNIRIINYCRKYTLDRLSRLPLPRDLLIEIQVQHILYRSGISQFESGASAKIALANPRYLEEIREIIINPESLISS